MEIKTIANLHGIPCTSLKLVLIKAKPNENNIVWVDSKPYLPYLISLTEDIEINDLFISKNGYGDWMIDILEPGMEQFITKPKRSFLNMNNSTIPHQRGEFKIMVKPEQIPNFVLINIANKLTTSDSILVAKCVKEMDQHPDWVPSYSDPDNSSLSVVTWYKLELDQDKKIIFI